LAYTADIRKIERRLLPADFKVTDWQHLEPWFKELEERPIDSSEALEHWLHDLSELEAVVSEDACWRHVRMTCDTTDKSLEEAFNFFYLEIQPRIQPYADRLNRKLVDCPFTKDLDSKRYFTYLRTVRKNIELFREENIPLQAEMSVLQQQYGSIAGRMTIEHEGKEYTLQQASRFLENPDRHVRETVYRKIAQRRSQDAAELHELFGKLVALRHRIAQNAGFDNYRDYKFAEMGRFDYTPADCRQFHEAVRTHVLPLVNEIYDHHGRKLGLDPLRPWDTEAEPEGTQPLRPFSDGKDLLAKTVDCFRRLDPFFADCLTRMDQMGHLDLDSRKGKAPGGYNMPLMESGAPFIFMNAAGQMGDVTTMVHEGGHAIHSFLSHPLELSAFKDYPTEMAELASMSMELFSMDHWEPFFDNEEDMKRAKRHQLERVITIFPWIATIDAFQHWVYLHPEHSPDERTQAWMDILGSFSTSAIDYQGLEAYRQLSWQRQLHLFEVPFYYIEYGIAQLAAIGMWKQYRENPAAALKNYTDALALGGTLTLPELYRKAGLSFDFSSETIRDLMEMVRKELASL
jgi:oligoendopeptidase F